MADDPQDLAKQLQDHYAAIEAEFDLLKSDDDPEKQIDVLRSRLGPKMPAILDALIGIATSGTSESAQIASARFLIAFMYGKDPNKVAEKDGFSKLMEALSDD